MIRIWWNASMVTGLSIPSRGDGSSCLRGCRFLLCESLNCKNETMDHASKQLANEDLNRINRIKRW